MEPQTWFFTFGENHTFPGTGEPLDFRFTKVRGTRDEATAQMRRHFGDQWQGPFPTAEQARVVDFGLSRLRSKFWPKAAAEVTR
ncbi:hypothetical protein [Micromonospora chokoriensis]|uniref:hypothetical protein n=1 Tax=Micromonospora chokoriensis TaxID=356851 RepID=UPI0004C3BCBA|nr:hypothetical protein [Micromonospora chokoriensis]